MKKVIFIMYLMVVACATTQEVQEDQLLISRKYIGDFIEFRQTGPRDGNGYNIVWIKTSMEKKYGKISVYGKKCDFRPGERLYLRRTLYSPGMVSAYWEYHIENDSTLSYQTTEFQHDKKTLIVSWFDD